MRHMLRAAVVVHGMAGYAAAAGEETVAGAYAFGHEVRSFQPCGSSAVYWARPLSPEIGQRLRARHGELSEEPYARVYVVLTGRPSDQPPTGFAASYDGYFDITGIVETARRIPGACALD